jgi:hypothetical protein
MWETNTFKFYTFHFDLKKYSHFEEAFHLHIAVSLWFIHLR